MCRRGRGRHECNERDTRMQHKVHESSGVPRRALINHRKGGMCCVLGRPLHRSTPWPACCRRRSGATLNLLPGPQSVSRDARPRRKSC